MRTGGMAGVAEALAGAEASRAESEALARLGRLAMVMGELAGARDVAAVTEIVVGHAADALEATVASLSLINGDQLELAGIRGELPGTKYRWAAHPLSAAVPASEAVRTGRPVFLAGREAIEARYPSLIGQLPEDRSIVVLPLIAGGRPLGVIALVFTGRRLPDEAQLTFLQTLADACAQALDRAGALAAAADRAVKLAFLANASAELSASLDYRTTLAKIARLAVPTLADWCTIEILEKGELRTLEVAHVDPTKVALAEELRLRYPPAPNAINGPAAVIRTGVGELISAIPDELLVAAAVDEEHLGLLRELELTSGLTVPLRARGKILGSLTLVASQSSRRYDESDLAFAEDLGRRAGMAIDNAQLFEESEQTGARLQNAVLPERVIKIPGWDIAVHYSAAGDTEIGGDFFDVVALDGNRVAVIIGDVAGRGIEAAAAMAQMRSAVRAYLCLDPDPVSVLDKLDRLFDRFDIAQLVTLAYVVIDADTQTIEVGNAGHLPSLLVHRDGEVDTLPRVISVPIGAGPAVRTTATAQFPDGATMLVYTDGLVERRGEDIDCGVQRLREAAPCLTAPDLRAALESVVAGLADVDRDDDVTAVAIRRVAPQT